MKFLLMPATIADIRRDYKLESLAEKDVHPNAIDQFARWWNEALKSKIDEVNAMTLATASRDGLPSARIVLLKGYDENGFVFYTNYNSFKGQQLAENPRACLVFFWKELERQVRITGLVEKISSAESDEYFNIRPEGSRLSAIASPQSQVIPQRDWLEKEVEQLMHQLSSNAIARPAYWGGYRVKPAIIEFWQGRPNRLHDRIQYTLQDDGGWKIERLAP
jgi:pyridoxamine 5'-phosphate oxidase